MATVKPLRGLRPRADIAAQITSLPYDVMDSEEARQIVKLNPYSFLRVTKSEVDLPVECDSHSPIVYKTAKSNLDEFIDQKLLDQDPDPCFYIYRQKMGTHEQVGVAAIFSVDEYEQGIIKKHELTRPDKEQDRVDHILATGAQTGPVFLTYQEDAHVSELIVQAMAKPATVHFVADDGIQHELYLVNQPELVDAIEQAFLGVDVLYIADGHHRTAAAARACDHLRRCNPDHTGQEAYNYFLGVAFPHTMMQIMDYNRVVADLAGLTQPEFLDLVGQSFTVTASANGAVKPAELQNFGMYLAGKWYLLTAREQVIPADSLTGRLDVSILQNSLLAPILNIHDVRTDKRIAFVGGIRGMAELEKLVDSGRFAVAFSLFPTAIEDLMAIADAGQIMPPKSTWFEPKLRDAMVVHLIGR